MATMRFSVQDIIRLEVCDPPQSVGKLLQRELHLYREALGSGETDPDILVTFTDHLVHEPKRQVGKCGFTKEHVILGQGDGRRLALRMSDLLERPLEIVAERGVDKWRLFSFTENLFKHVASRKGYAFIHSSGLVVEGKAVLFSGWRKSGKSAVAYALLDEKSALLGDDFTILGPNGMVYPYVRSIQLPPRLYANRSDLFPMSWRNHVKRFAHRCLAALPGPSPRAQAGKEALLKKVVPTVEPWRTPMKIAKEPARLDRLFYVVQAAETGIRKMDDVDLIIETNRYERAQLEELVRLHAEADDVEAPGRLVALLDDWQEAEEQLLRAVSDRLFEMRVDFGGKWAGKVRSMITDAASSEI